MTAYRNTFEHLADELRCLDLLIRLRLGTMALQNEATPQAQEARTVYISRQEIDWLLDQDAGVPFSIGQAADEVALKQLSAEVGARVRDSEREGVELPLAALDTLFGLSPLEQSAVVICLAPELRRKYDRLYAFLQDDITRARPSVDLVLELLCATEEQRWAARSSFSATAPLLRHGILRTVEDPQSPSGSSGLASFLSVDPRICQFLLGAAELDGRLADRARLHREPMPEPVAAAETEPEPEPGLDPGLDPAVSAPLLRLAQHHRTADGRPLVCYLRGPAGNGKLDLARYTSHRLGLALVSIDARTLTGPDAGLLLQLAFREGRLHRAAVHLAHADMALREETRPLLAALAAAVQDCDRPVFLSGESHWTGGTLGVGVHPVAVPLPDLARGTAIWRRGLAAHTADPAEAERWAAELAGRYRLPPARIRAAVRQADDQRLMEPEPRPLTWADVSAACRRQSSRALGQVAVKVESRCGWDDLVLPADRIAQLRDVCDQVRHRQLVLHRWGFGAKLSHGTGLSVLFSGPPGTGKTMAAEVLARELDVDLYKVDLSGIVSKYIGETEKNLARIFAEARTGNAILFFDEADALFGKRTEVSDAHDRYANIETSYLLQQMEEYEGIVVLATNLRQNIDDAFTRRIRFIVEFPFPESEDRRRIWQTLFPPGAPLAADVDFARLAKEFPVTGANIKNIALNAAFLAAADAGTIGSSHILRGTRREFEKIGKLWTGES